MYYLQSLSNLYANLLYLSNCKFFVTYLLQNSKTLYVFLKNPVMRIIFENAKNFDHILV